VSSPLGVAVDPE